MTARTGRGLPHLAAALDRPAPYDAGTAVTLARLAEQGGLDFVTLGDSFARPGPDALQTLARVAPATRRVGLVPTVPATHTEPWRAPAAVATLDWVSGGRAGWRIDVPDTGRESPPVGRGHAVSQERLWHEAGEAADAAARLWDGRHGGTPSGEAVSATDAAHGARCVPPPQGHPVVVVDATRPEARATAARHADVVLVQAASPAQADALRGELLRTAAGHGRDPGTLRVFASFAVHLGGGERAADPGHGGGGPRHCAEGLLYRGAPVDLAGLITEWYVSGAVDGFHLVPVEPARDLERLVNGTVALLRHRGLFRTLYPGGTLREHLGLPRAARRPVSARESV